MSPAGWDGCWPFGAPEELYARFPDHKGWRESRKQSDQTIREVYEAAGRPGRSSGPVSGAAGRARDS
jgi:hypothetical protein